MTRAGRFEKVSLREFDRAMRKVRPDASDGDIRDMYDAILLPVRATAGSAGYDFHMPFPCTLPPGDTDVIPTGVRVKINPGWWLGCFPRSGLGFKYRLQLDNTVGVIDSDYYGSANEGHIFAKITNDGRDGGTLVLERGDAFMQGVFLPYGITYDDASTEKRDGGFGSTSKRGGAGIG